MKKFLLVVMILVVSTLGVYSQEAWLGIGRVLTSSNGNALVYETGFETNYNFGGRWLTNDGKFGLSITLTKDTAKIGRWLLKHNFIDKETLTYNYVKITPAVEYNFKSFYLIFATPIFTSPNKDVTTKVGIEVGVGGKHYFGKHFGVQSTATFCHLQDFVLPVVNTFFVDFAVIYKW